MPLLLHLELCLRWPLFLFTFSWAITIVSVGAQNNLFPIEDYLIDDQHSYIGFKIKYFGFSPVRGRFNSFRGHILYDSSDIEKTSATLFVDAPSINTGVNMRDDDLKGPSWFDAEKFPHISFRSISVTDAPDGFQLKGLLKIKSKVDTVVIDFEAPTKISRDFAGNKQVDFSGRVQIKRSDFGILGEGFWNSLMDGKLQQLSDEVDIELDIHCRRPDYLIREAELEPDDIRKTLLQRLESASNEQWDGILSTYDEEAVRDSAKVTSGVLSTIGYILLARNEPDLAQEVFERRLKWFPQSMTAEIALAKTAAIRGNHGIAKRHLEKALANDSTDTRALELWRMLTTDRD